MACYRVYRSRGVQARKGITAGGSLDGTAFACFGIERVRAQHAIGFRTEREGGGGELPPHPESAVIANEENREGPVVAGQ